MAREDFNISDGADDDEHDSGSAEVEEEEEEKGEQGEGEDGEGEGTEPEPGSEAHRRARGDAVEEEEEEVDEDALREIAGQGSKRGNTMRERLSAVTKQRDDAIAASMKLVEKVAGAPAVAAAKKDAPPPYDFKAKRREANKLLLEGDEEGAAAIQDEMDAERERIAQANADARADTRVAVALEEERALRVCGEIFEKLPYLNVEDKDRFNAEAFEDFEVMRDGFLKKGESLSEAIRKAANKVSLLHVVEEDDPPAGGKKAGKKDAAAAGDDDDDDDGDDADAGGKRKTNREILDRLRKRTVANAKAANRQPPQIAKAGIAHRERLDVSKIDVEKLTDKEFEDLPESVKKQLRGDSVSA